MYKLLEQQQNQHLSDLSTLFGTKQKIQIGGSMPIKLGEKPGGPALLKNNSKGGAKNHIVLKNDEAIGRCHFRVRFCPYRNKYLIKDMGDGSGTFIRIEEPTVLQSGTVICVGESHIIVGLIYDNFCDNKEIKSNIQSINLPNSNANDED